MEDIKTSVGHLSVSDLYGIFRLEYIVGTANQIVVFINLKYFILSFIYQFKILIIINIWIRAQ